MMSSISSRTEHHDTFNTSIKLERAKQYLIVLQAEKVIKNFPMPVKDVKSESTDIKMESQETSKFELKSALDNEGISTCDNKFETAIHLSKHKTHYIPEETQDIRKNSLYNDKREARETELNGTKVNLFETLTKDPVLEELKPKSIPSKLNGLKCENCPKFFKFQSCLNKHNCVTKCKICGCESPTVIANTAHLRLFHRNVVDLWPFPCDICKRRFTKEPFLQNHKRLVHFKGMSKEFECDIDGKIFRSNYEIRIHMRSHIQPIECKICGKKVKEFGMKVHIYNFHTSYEAQNQYQCEICPKRFKSFYLLKSHKGTHEKKFECPICKQKLSLKCHIKKHERQHALDKLNCFECELCGLKFSKIHCLKRHKSIHSSNRAKSFKCSRCDFATNIEENLLSHQNSHKLKDKRIATIKNPLKCDKCPAVLRNRQALKCHMINVHPSAPFECDLCGRIINAKTNMIKHMKFHLSVKNL